LFSIKSSFSYPKTEFTGFLCEQNKWNLWPKLIRIKSAQLEQYFSLFLPGLFMLGMFVTERAIFFVAHSFRMFPFIFGAGVVPLFTLLTR